MEQKDDTRDIKDGVPREDYLRAAIRKNRAGENNMEVMFRYYKGTQILDEEESRRINKTDD